MQDSCLVEDLHATTRLVKFEFIQPLTVLVTTLVFFFYLFVSKSTSIQKKKVFVFHSCYELGCKLPILAFYQARLIQSDLKMHQDFYCSIVQNECNIYICRGLIGLFVSSSDSKIASQGTVLRLTAHAFPLQCTLTPDCSHFQHQVYIMSS